MGKTVEATFKSPSYTVEEGFPEPHDVKKHGYAYPLRKLTKQELDFDAPYYIQCLENMDRLLNIALTGGQVKPHFVMSTILAYIECNERDGPRFQRAFIECLGVEKFFEYFKSSVKEERKESVAVIGRMLSCCEASRTAIIEKGGLNKLLALAKDDDAEVRENVTQSLKGAFCWPEGREHLSIDMLLEAVTA